MTSIQESCTGDDEELVVGSIYGLRQWLIRQGESDYEDGLYGHWDYRWDVTGINTATCEKTHQFLPAMTGVKDHPELTVEEFAAHLAQRAQGIFQRNPDALTLVSGSFIIYATDTYDNMLPKLTSFATLLRRSADQHYTRDWDILVPRTPHETPGVDCTCGIYAYTSEDSLFRNSYSDMTSALGIVRSWGLVTQGSKGFRAQHAQIIGITGPTEKRYDWSSTPSSYWDTPEDLESRDILAGAPRYGSIEELLEKYKELTR